MHFLSHTFPKYNWVQGQWSMNFYYNLKMKKKIDFLALKKQLLGSSLLSIQNIINRYLGNTIIWVMLSFGGIYLN